jgi:hypothetical protein
MAAGTYVVTLADGTTVVDGPLRWDPIAEPDWKPQQLLDNPGAGYKVLPETPTRRNTGALSVTEQNRSTIVDRAGRALAVNATFLAIATPTNGQVLTQVQRLTRQVSALIRLQLGAFDDTSDT